MTNIVDNQRPVDCRVRVWFGEHVIADYTSAPAKAAEYHAAMTRRFAGLRVTIEAADAVANDHASNS